MARLSRAEFARIARALADPERTEILEAAAAARDVCCSELVGRRSVGQATISHHLKELSTAGLLERRKQGQFAYYRFVPAVLSAYVDELERRMRLDRRARPAPRTR